MIVCQVCVRAYGKTPVHLKSVFKMSTVCSNASSKSWTPLPDRFIDDHLVEMFPLFDQAGATSAGRRHVAAVHTILQLPSNLVVDWVTVRTVGWPQSCSDEVWCFMSNRCTVSRALMAGRLSAVCNAILETEYFVINI